MSTCVSCLDTQLMTRIAGVWHSNAVLDLRWFSRLTLLEMVGSSSFPRQRQAGPLEETWLSRKTSRHQKVPSTEPDHGPESQTGDKTIVKTRILQTSRLHQNDSVFNKDLERPTSGASDTFNLVPTVGAPTQFQPSVFVSLQHTCESTSFRPLYHSSRCHTMLNLQAPKSQDHQSPRVTTWSR